MPSSLKCPGTGCLREIRECGRIVYVTFRTWWKFFHNFPLAWWTDNDWNFILEEMLLPAEQGTRYGAVVTGWFKKWYTSKPSVRAVAGRYLWMGAELKVHSLRMSFCLSTDTLLEAYTNTQSLLEELRLETVSRLLPKPVTRGNRNSAPSDPLKRKWNCDDSTSYRSSEKISNDVVIVLM